MTVNLMSRSNNKKRNYPVTKIHKINVDDFNNVFTTVEGYPDLDIEIELSDTLKPKRTKMVTLDVNSRSRARLNNETVEIYAEI